VSGRNFTELFCTGELPLRYRGSFDLSYEIAQDASR
jgi:hypothetical protein